MNAALRTSARTQSGRDDWTTPADVLDRVRQLGVIALDPCSGPGSLVGARRSFTKRDNGLTRSWTIGAGEVCFVNPPYSELQLWTSKCVGEARGIVMKGGALLLLIPSRTDTIAWHSAAPTATRILLVMGRLKFGGSKIGAPFPSAILFWGSDSAAFEKAFGDMGMVLTPQTTK